MYASVRLLAAVAIVLAVALSSPAADDGLSRVELGKLGKAATVLIESKARQAHGSAFCVHPSGLFLTNEHVIRAEIASSTPVTLIMNPGLKDQKVLQAKVVRHDKDLDLALLRVEGAKELPVLALGTDDKLTELMELVAFGFPFGTALSPDKKEYPAISINVGSITSLRHKGGVLHRIQLDAALNPGNSGGPVLDKSGKVVGMVVAGVQGSGVNFAIPVGQVLGFVARPDLQFTPPVLDAKNQHEPVLFQARAVPVLPDAKPLALELILKVGDGPERRHKLEAADGMYQVKAVAVPAPEGALQLQMAAAYDNGTLNAAVADRAIKVGGQEVKLSGVRSVYFKPKERAVLQDGKTLEGAITGLEAVPVRLGQQTLTLNLAKAVEAKFLPPAAVDAVAYTLVVTREGKEVARLSDTLAIRGVVRTVSGDPARADTKSPLLESEKVVKELPSTVSEVMVGGGGRYLILHLPKVRKLAIFDVNEAKVAHYIALAEDDVKFAASMDKLLLVLPSSNVLQRWSLKTFEREVTATVPVKGTVKGLLMGSASNGPLLVNNNEAERGGAVCTFLDIDSLKILDLKGPNNQPLRIGYDSGVNMRMSADGRVIGYWNSNLSPQGIATLVRVGNEWKSYSQHDSAGHVIPGPDGKVIFTARGLFTSEVKVIGDSGRMGGAYCLPALQGNYYLALKLEQKSSASVYMLGDSRPLINLTNLELVEGINQWDREGFTADKRIHFIPDAKLIITIPASNDRLILHRFDVEEALDKSGIDYLYVTSQPPLSTKKGETFAYQLAVKSKKGGLKYKLESGPKGMRITDSGQLTWSVPAGEAEAQADVIVSIRDAGGQECFHTFKISIGN